MPRQTRKMVNLDIEETSGVDHPAHLHEGWLVMKAAPRDEVEKAMAPRKTEEGVEFPAEAYAYVPDPEMPSTWKLRLWETPDRKETARQVGMAVAALGPGFRGQKVQIPSGDMTGVKSKVKAAWKKANPDRDESEMPPVLKSTEEVNVDDMDKAEDKKPSYDDLMMQLDKANARIAEMEKEMKGMKKPADGKEDMPEFLQKEAPEEVRKAFEDMQKALDAVRIEKDAAEVALRKERTERADAEAVAKASTAYAHLGLDANVVGPALRRLGDTDADLAKSIDEVLTAANARVESADIFSEIGKSRPSLGSAYERAEAMAKAAVADSKAATFEQALADVFTSDPALYSQYRSEQGK